MATERTRDTMTERIGALLNLADNASTTEESDAFRRKAFELIAKHGISESAARGTVREGSNIIEVLTFDLTGQYITQQRHLLNGISGALHCVGLTIENGRDVKRVKVYGVKIHTDRVRLLFGVLKRSMLAGVARITAPPHGRRNTRSTRLDWLLGYTNRITELLIEAEETATREADAANGTTTQALALVSDRERATAALTRQHKVTKARTYSRFVGDAYAQGRAAAERTNIPDGPS